MKIMNLKIILYILFTFTFVGCSEDFLDKQPLDEIVSSNFYATEDDAMEALVSVYDAFGYQSSPGISWSVFLTVSDTWSDDALAGGGDANDGFDEDQINNYRIPTTNLIVHSLWLKNYTGIYRANLFLEKIVDIDASDEFKSRTIAEAKFFRAYFYFELARFFENIPLLTNTIGGPSEYSQTQNTPTEVYNQIALDLVESIEDLPTMLPNYETGRITRWAAEALLARVYLFYNGVYGADLQAGSITVNRSVALDYIEDLIGSGYHELLPNYEDIFRLASEFSVESVLEISYGDSPAWWDWGYVRGAEGNLAAQLQGPRVTGSDDFNRGWSFAPVTEKLVRDMSGDPRLATTVIMEDDLTGTVVKGYQHTGYYSKKYSSDAEHWGSDGQFEHNRTCNFRVIRYSDVLLMAAELGSPNAQSYLDQVRARVGLESIPVSTENIFKERRLELALEGIRYYDVIRRGLATAEEEFTNIGVRGPNYEGDQQIFDVTFNQTTRGLLPIPQTEIDLSGGNFMQNAGY